MRKGKTHPLLSTRRKNKAGVERSVPEPVLSRSGVEPPTGTIHPRQISSRNSKSGKASPAMNLLIGFCFLSVVPLPLRGWSFPVGGSTPDRHRAACRFCVRGGSVIRSGMCRQCFRGAESRGCGTPTCCRPITDCCSKYAPPRRTNARWSSECRNCRPCSRQC